MLNARIGRNSFSVHDLLEEDTDLGYWLEQTPQDRIYAIEMMRRINYGNDIATTRLCRFFEIAEFPPR